MKAEEGMARVSEIRRDKETGMYCVDIKLPPYISNPIEAILYGFNELAKANEARKKKERKARRVADALAFEARKEAAE